MNELFRINLRLDQPELRPHRHSGIHQGPLGRALRDAFVVASLAAVLVETGVILWKDAQSAERYNTLLTQVQTALKNARQMEQDIQAATELRSRRQAVINRINEIQAVDKDRFTWAMLLQEVASALTEKLWITKIEEQEGAQATSPRVRAVLKGRAATPSDILTYKRKLETSSLIAEANLVRNEPKELSGQTVHEFEIVVVLQTVDPAEMQNTDAGATDGAVVPADSAAVTQPNPAAKVDFPVAPRLPQ